MFRSSRSITIWSVIGFDDVTIILFGVISFSTTRSPNGSRLTVYWRSLKKLRSKGFFFDYTYKTGMEGRSKSSVILKNSRVNPLSSL